MTGVDAIVAAVQAGHTITFDTGVLKSAPVKVDVIGPTGARAVVTVDADKVDRLDVDLPDLLAAVRATL